MIVEITTDVFPFDVVISCDKPEIIEVIENEPISVTIEMTRDGADGKSAYAIAVENGYIGTEIQWLESQKNIDGGLIF